MHDSGVKINLESIYTQIFTFGALCGEGWPFHLAKLHDFVGKGQNPHVKIEKKVIFKIREANVFKTSENRRISF